MDNSFRRTARVLLLKAAQRCASCVFEVLVNTKLSYSHAPLFEVAAIRKSGNK
jgi:hypothetical protein